MVQPNLVQVKDGHGEIHGHPSIGSMTHFMQTGAEHIVRHLDGRKIICAAAIPSTAQILGILL
jgi:hypothetical protein